MSIMIRLVSPEEGEYYGLYVDDELVFWGDSDYLEPETAIIFNHHHLLALPFELYEIPQTAYEAMFDEHNQYAPSFAEIRPNVAKKDLPAEV